MKTQIVILLFAIIMGAQASFDWSTILGQGGYTP